MRLLIICLLVFAPIRVLPAWCSSINDTTKTVVDTNLTNNYVSHMDSFFREASIQSASDYAFDKALIRQSKIFEEIKEVSRSAKSFLKNNFDTVALNLQLENLAKWRKLSGDGVFENKGTAHTSRNLTATYNILHALNSQVSSYKRQVDGYHEQLINYRLAIDSLSNDPSLFIFSKDSTELSEYVTKLRLLSKAVTPINQQLAHDLAVIQGLQDKVNLEALHIDNGMEEVLFYQKQIAERGLIRDFAPLWEKSKYDRPWSDIQYYSVLKAKLVLSYFLQAHLGKVVLFGFLLVAIIMYTFSLRKGMVQDQKLTLKDSILLGSPLLSSMVIAFSVGQFLFPNPPFIFSTLILTTTGILLTVTFWRFITTYWLGIWISIFLLYFLAATDNMVLQASRSERYIMIFISLSAVCLASLAIVHKGKHSELQERWILVPIGLMGVSEIAAFVFNIFGIFNISKAIMVAGLLNVVVAIVFLWVVRLVNEGLSFASSLYVKRERRLFYINYNRVGKRAPTFFYLLLIAGWFILLGRNFYEFRFLSEPFYNFFYQNHQIGSYSFSVINIVIFFLIMLGATISSKIVSFFAADPPMGTQHESAAKTIHFGSWILLVRISIFTLGFIFAFQAVGIPLQQLTLIISALGVGIGFGLQALVNNLVSGLIIAVEKPVNVDDSIEINGQLGKVKSIGFRSSVIATADGADLIMPNGDLLNSHVLNWSLGGQRRRLQISCKIRYGSDLEQVKNLVTQTLSTRDQILKYPQPMIEFTEVTAQVVTIAIYFWVSKSKDAAQIKSDLLVFIMATFQTEGIVLATPQPEIHIVQRDSNSRIDGDSLDKLTNTNK